MLKPKPRKFRCYSLFTVYKCSKLKFYIPDYKQNSQTITNINSLITKIPQDLQFTVQRNYIFKVCPRHTHYLLLSSFTRLLLFKTFTYFPPPTVATYFKLSVYCNTMGFLDKEAYILDNISTTSVVYYFNSKKKIKGTDKSIFLLF